MDMLKYKRRFEDEHWEVLEPIPQPAYEKSEKTVGRYIDEGVEYMANRFKERYIKMMDFHKNPDWEKFQDVWLPEVASVQDAMMTSVAKQVSSAVSWLTDKLSTLGEASPIVKTAKKASERRGTFRKLWDVIEKHDDAKDALFISPDGKYVGKGSVDGMHIAAIQRLILNKGTAVRKVFKDDKKMMDLFDKMGTYRIAIDDNFSGIRIASPEVYQTGKITARKLSSIKKYMNELQDSGYVYDDNATIFIESMNNKTGDIFSYEVPNDVFRKVHVNGLEKYKKIVERQSSIFNEDNIRGKIF